MSQFPLKDRNTRSGALYWGLKIFLFLLILPMLLLLLQSFVFVFFCKAELQYKLVVDSGRQHFSFSFKIK